ncbi:MAG: hypothetical protein ACLFRU_03765 [Paracoccaceae bacterium]
MSITRTHDLHRRRLGRNVGLALSLVVFIAVIFGLTVVKVSRGEYTPPKLEAGN